jgi:hypothetical protein
MGNIDGDIDSAAVPPPHRRRIAAASPSRRSIAAASPPLRRPAAALPPLRRRITGRLSSGH